MVKNNPTADFGKELPYDLRQIYAVDIVGEHLKDIAAARKADNYSLYLKCLKDLFIVIHHKIKNKKVEIKDIAGNKKEVSTTDYYNALLKEASKVANDYRNDFIGQTKSSEGCVAIEEVLNNIEMFLYNYIEEAKMFGSSRHIPGL